LLNENRNPGITREVAEDRLKTYLGAEKVLWLGEGVPGDETGGHIDNIACFVRPGVVLLSWTDDPAEPLYPVCREAEARLLASTDAKGRAITVEHIPAPAPMFYTKDETASLDASEWDAQRPAGERMAGSYVNFLIINGAIIAAKFGLETDAAAHEVLARLFPDREIVMVPGREILLGGGNIHCITQQQPASRK